MVQKSANLLYSVHTPRLCDNLNEVVVFEQL